MEVIAFQDEDEKNKPPGEGCSTCSPELGSAIEKNDGRLIPNTVLALLDDKNKAISLLKRQVENQQLQLGFYLHRELSSPKITELAGTCAPGEVEENIQVNLAMTKFYREAGLNSKIMLLHERMKHLERRALSVLDQQEEMVKEIVMRLREFSRDPGSEEGIVQFIMVNLKEKSTAVDILGKIAGCSNKLRKELDTFRTCCSRLVAVEDERNSLVEQVYSMPVTQRMSYGVLLAAQYEKMRLEKEVQEIRRDQKTLQERLAALSHQESGTDTGQCAITATGDQLDLQQMLNTVNAEAVSLLTMAKAQRDKYLEEIAKVTERNDDLSSQIASMKEQVREKEGLEARLQEILQQYDALKEQSCNRLNEMYVRYQLLADENSDMKRRLAQFQDIEEQVKFLRSQIDDMDAIRRQRDYFKSQVDDLQAIRAAYSQLVEQPVALTRGEESENITIQQQSKKIEEMEHQQERMGAEITNLEDIVGEQQSQIKHLLTIIFTLGHVNDSKNVTKRNNSTNSENYWQPLNTTTYTKNDIQFRHVSSNACSQTDGLPHRGSYIEKDRYSEACGLCSPFYTPPNSVHGQPMATTTMCALISDESKTTKHKNEVLQDIQPVAERKTDKGNGPLFNDSELHNRVKGSTTQNFIGVKPFVSTTSVQVQTTNREGKSESMRAVLQSSTPIDSVIQMNNSTALTLRLTCNHKSESDSNQDKAQTVLINKCLTPIISEQELVTKEESTSITVTPVMDEFELMKDSSNETLITTLPSLHRQTEDVVQVKHLEITSSNGQTVKVSQTQLAVRSSIGVLHKANDEIRFATSRESITKRTGSDFSDSEVEACSSIIDSDRTQLCKPCEERALIKPAERALVETGDILNLSSRLKQITCYLDQALATREGTDMVLDSVRAMYDAVFNDVTSKRNSRERSQVAKY